MDLVTVLQRAHEVGLTWRWDGETLVVQGPPVAEQIAEELIARKLELKVIELFEGESDDTSFLEEAEFNAASFNEGVVRRCWTCGSRRLWRLRGVPNWVCPVCHPPSVSEERIEWIEEVAP